MSEEFELSQIHTACKNCVFAKYEKNTQIGCKLNKIKDYENANIDVVEVTDNSQNFYVINGRFCMFYRNEEVMKNYPKDNWEEITKLQTKVPYHAMIIVNKDSTFSEIKKTMRMLKDQDTSPNLVTIINKQYSSYVKDPEKYIAPSKLIDLLQNSEFHQFSMKNIYDDDMDDRALVDLVFDGSKSKPLPFYVVFESGFEIPLKFSEEFNNSILINMKQIGFVKPVDHINGMIVNKTTHKKYSGNAFNVCLEDKMLKYEENAEKYIFEVGDICPPIVTGKQILFVSY